MNLKEELIYINGKYIEVSLSKTIVGDYVGMASYRGSLIKGISRSKNKRIARDLCINRLLNILDSVKEDEAR